MRWVKVWNNNRVLFMLSMEHVGSFNESYRIKLNDDDNEQQWHSVCMCGFWLGFVSFCISIPFKLSIWFTDIVCEFNYYLLLIAWGGRGLGVFVGSKKSTSPRNWDLIKELTQSWEVLPFLSLAWFRESYEPKLVQIIQNQIA